LGAAHRNASYISCAQGKYIGICGLITI